MVSWRMLVLGLAVGVLSCSGEPDLPGRSAVGSHVPEGFEARPVASAAAAAAYVLAYAAVLRVDGLRVDRVADLGDRYFVYVREAKTARGAFGLEVAANGDLGPKRFPSMEPEMMWNQKYGHRSQPREEAIVTPLEADAARRLAETELRGKPALSLGPAESYYGYHLFLLLEGGRPVGEAAVHAVDGRVVWARFPASFRGVQRAEPGGGG